jgi:hypothetical protein
MLAGSGQINFIRFFEPFKHLRWGDRPFRQMRIERARADIWRVDQSRSRKCLGLSLVRKCFGYPCLRSRLFGLKRNVPPPFAGHDEPRALGLAGHDGTLSRLRRSLGVGDKPKLLGILGNAQRDLRDLNQPRADSFPAIQSLPPAGAVAALILPLSAFAQGSAGTEAADTARALSAPPHRLRWGHCRSFHFFAFSPQSSAHFVPSKDQFLSERKKKGRSPDSALVATSISRSGILYDLRSRRAHRIAWR